MYGENGYATEYFRNSPHWKIEVNDFGTIKGWYGPYPVRMYTTTFYLYCKTNNVFDYWEDFLEYKLKK